MYLKISVVVTITRPHFC